MKLSDRVRENRATRRNERDVLQTKLDALVDRAKAENRNLRASEQREFDRTIADIKRLDAELAEFDVRYEELLEDESRRADVDAVHASIGAGGENRFYTTPSSVYHRDDRSGPSYFMDLYHAKHGRGDSIERLQRNAREVNEHRSGDMNSTAGTGGEFAPPAWLVDEFVKLARPGRVFADRCVKDELPSGVSSINLPKVATGSTTAIQALQNSSLSDTAMTTTSVTSGISTIGGAQVVSTQLVAQSGIPFDQVILADLAADYAKQLDAQVISGSGSSGQLNGVYQYFNASGTVNQTYTNASPAVVGTGQFYSQVNHAIEAIAAARYLPADTIIMHPRRWAWIASAFDSQNRPLVVPNGGSVNTIAVAGEQAAEGYVGSLCGLPVYTDSNIQTNLGAGTNQDPCYVGRFADLFLWESPLQMEAFDSTYANNASILFRCMAYSAFIPSRYTTSVAIINGTGMVSPTY